MFLAHAPAHFFRQATSSLVMGASFAAQSLRRFPQQSSSSSQSPPVPQQEQQQQQQPQFRQYYGSTTVSNARMPSRLDDRWVHCQDNDDNNNNNNAGQSSRGGGGWSFPSSWATRTMRDEDITAAGVAADADTSIAVKTIETSGCCGGGGGGGSGGARLDEEGGRIAFSERQRLVASFVSSVSSCNDHTDDDKNNNC